MYRRIDLLMLISVGYLLRDVSAVGNCDKKNDPSMCTSTDTTGQKNVHLTFDKAPKSAKNISCFCYLYASETTDILAPYSNGHMETFPNITVRSDQEYTLNYSSSKWFQLDTGRNLTIHYSGNTSNNVPQICISFTAYKNDTRLHLTCLPSWNTSIPANPFRSESVTTTTASTVAATESNTNSEGVNTEKEVQTTESTRTDIVMIAGATGGGLLVVIIIVVLTVIICRRWKLQTPQKQDRVEIKTTEKDDDHYNVENVLYISADGEVTYDTADYDVMYEKASHDVVFHSSKQNQRAPSDETASSNEYAVIVKDRRSEPRVVDDEDTYNHVTRETNRSAPATENTYDVAQH